MKDYGWAPKCPEADEEWRPGVWWNAADTTKPRVKRLVKSITGYAWPALAKRGWKIVKVVEA